MRSTLRRYRVLVMVVLAIAAVGCVGKSPKVTYYTLSPVSQPGTSASDSLAIAVGPADFPRALDRPQIATRVGPNRVDYDEFHRWAGTLHSDFLNAASTNLSRLLATDRVVVYPAPPSFPIDYRVMFDIVRFDADASGNVALEARWMLMPGDGGDALDVGTFRTTRTASGDDYDARAAAHSAAVGELCEAVAEQIRSRPAG